MSRPIRVSFATWCRSTRMDLDITQQELGHAVGVSRSYVARLESGRANPTLALVDRIGEALGLRFELTAQRPTLIGPRQRDVVHARCTAYTQRRLSRIGFAVAREVEVADRRSHGWIDLLAFDPRTSILYIIEVKTSIDDVGRLERQLGWYERLAATTPVAVAWRPTRIRTWVLALASTEVDTAVLQHGELFRQAFPLRATEMRAALAGVPATSQGRGMALIDPRSRRRDWLIPLRADGRRAPLPYQDRAGAERLLIGASS